jgi:hypothetical protein
MLYHILIGSLNLNPPIACTSVFHPNAGPKEDRVLASQAGTLVEEVTMGREIRVTRE